MAVSLQEAASKWARKTQAVGAKWQQNTQGKAGAYCEGLAKLGVNASACMSGAGARYQQGVSSVSPQQFQAAIAGKEQKWATNFVAGLSGS
jgi:hypothetical protein